jgi:glycosyltransferase involved in cell wall biosynthesis
MNEVTPKISIGLPIFNGEKFVHKQLERILDQTFTNFELIISDNASTDLTNKICKEFESKDNRVRYYKQNETTNSLSNYNFVLEKAEGEYFLWVAVDDILLPDFLEKNLEILIKNQNIVCSASQVEYFGESRKYWNNKAENNITGFFIKRIVNRFQNLKNYSTTGTFTSKFRYYLKLRGHHHIFYGIYRTDQLKKIVSKVILGNTITVGIDLATILSALEFGDFYVIDEILMYRYDGGESSQGFSKFKKSYRFNFIKAISYNFPLTKWCFKKFGYKLCLKNLDMFILWNLEPIFFLLVELIPKK